MTALIEVHYLPSVSYFSALQGCSIIVLERNENFPKQTYRNRCQIVAAKGPQNLIVPVTMKPGKVLITDVRIDYSQKWLNNHWRTIQSAYGKAPFFEYYRDDLHDTLMKKSAFLYDLNLELLSMCLKWLKQDVTIMESLAYDKTVEKGTADLRSMINAKNMADLKFIFQPVPYTQVFGNAFAANASIIDLIFCEGPGAARIVQNSKVGD
ncbi:MAG: WbqC family protein [Chryseolinea sp.]